MPSYRVRGMRNVEPSESVMSFVPMTPPGVGTPITLPTPRALKMNGNTSASENERSLMSTTTGLSQYKAGWVILMGEPRMDTRA